jgi:hypothetical protein
MPALVQRGTNFWLSCQYELQAAGGPPSSSWAGSQRHATGAPDSEHEQLYSVKWYKNNEEFYRLIFAPAGGADQQQYFTQPGVNVLVSRRCAAPQISARALPPCHKWWWAGAAPTKPEVARCRQLDRTDTL